MGWDGTGGCETTPTVGNFDVYMVTTACNDFVHYSIVGSRYSEYMLYGCHNINVIRLSLLTSM